MLIKYLSEVYKGVTQFHTTNTDQTLTAITHAPINTKKEVLMSLLESNRFLTLTFKKMYVHFDGTSWHFCLFILMLEQVFFTQLFIYLIQAFLGNTGFSTHKNGSFLICET